MKGDKELLVKERKFGVIDDQQVTLFTVKNKNGFEVSCMNYGCVITEVLAADRRGQYENVVLGYDSLEEYGQNSKYLGAVVGRAAGRIKGGAFRLGGMSIMLHRMKKAITYMEDLKGSVMFYGILLCWKAQRKQQLSLLT